MVIVYLILVSTMLVRGRRYQSVQSHLQHRDDRLGRGNKRQCSVEKYSRIEIGIHEWSLRGIGQRSPVPFPSQLHDRRISKTASRRVCAMLTPGIIKPCHLFCIREFLCWKASLDLVQPQLSHAYPGRPRKSGLNSMSTLLPSFSLGLLNTLGKGWSSYLTNRINRIKH